MNKVNLAIIGYGLVGKRHAEAIEAYPNANLSSIVENDSNSCLLYTSPSPRDRTRSRMPSSA